MTRRQKRKVAKAIRFTIVTIGVLGFFVVYGSVGALEQDLIGFRQYFIQSGLGFVAMFASKALYDFLFD